MTIRTATHRPVPLNAIPDFTPVPRKVSMSVRAKGWSIFPRNRAM